jgi:hypothetical protein
MGQPYRLASTAWLSDAADHAIHAQWERTARERGSCKDLAARATAKALPVHLQQPTHLRLWTAPTVSAISRRRAKSPPEQGAISDRPY